MLCGLADRVIYLNTMTPQMDVRITIIVGVKSNNFHAKIYTALNKESKFKKQDINIILEV